MKTLEEKLEEKIKYREEREKSTRLYEEFRTSRGVKHTKGSPNPSRLIDKREGGNFGGGGWVDHINMWVKDGKAVIFTSEPYHIGDDDRAKIKTLATKLGINYRIIPPSQTTSMWVPGQTWLVALVRKGYEELLPEEMPRRREAVLATRNKRG